MLDGALRNMVYWEVSLLIAEVLELSDLKDPFQDKTVNDFIQKDKLNLAGEGEALPILHSLFCVWSLYEPSVAPPCVHTF